MARRIVATQRRPERHLADDEVMVPTVHAVFYWAGNPSWRRSFVMVEKVEIDFVGSRGYCEVPSTANATFIIRRIRALDMRVDTIGTVTFVAGWPHSLTFTGYYAPTIFEPGDILQLEAPSPQDVTLLDANVSIRCVRVP